MLICYIVIDLLFIVCCYYLLYFICVYNEKIIKLWLTILRLIFPKDEIILPMNIYYHTKTLHFIAWISRFSYFWFNPPLPLFTAYCELIKLKCSISNNSKNMLVGWDQSGYKMYHSLMTNTMPTIFHFFFNWQRKIYIVNNTIYLLLWNIYFLTSSYFHLTMYIMSCTCLKTWSYTFLYCFVSFYEIYIF